MKLHTLNRWLRRIGFVLVIEVEKDPGGLGWTMLRLERASRHPLVRPRPRMGRWR